MKRNTLQRAVPASVATAVAIVTRMAAQLLLVPLYLRVWGDALTGEWLMLLVIPAYLMIADYGLGTVVGAKLGATLEGEVDTSYRRRLIDTLKTANAILCIVGGTIVMVFWVVFNDKLQGWFVQIGSEALPWVFGFLTAAGLISILTSSSIAIIRGLGGYHLSAILQTFVAMSELVLILAAVLLLSDPIYASGAFLASRFVGICCATMIERRMRQGIEGPSTALLERWRALHGLFVPAFDTWLVSGGQILALQAQTILIGLLLSPVAVAGYVAARVLARAVEPVFSIFFHINLPESSYAGSGDEVREIHVNSFQLALCLFLIGCVSSPLVVMFFHLWVGEAVDIADSVILIVFLTYLVAGLSAVSLGVMIGSLRHGMYARLQIFGIFLFFIVAGLFLYFTRSMKVFVLVLFVYELFRLYMTVLFSLRATNDTAASFFRSIFALSRLRRNFQVIRSYALGVMAK